MKFTVGFSKARSWYKIGSRVISEVEKRNYSHAFIIYTDPITNLQLVAQASHGFINIQSLELFEQKNIIQKTYEFEITEEQFKKLLLFVQKNLGTDYGYLALVWIGIKKILHIELNIHDKDATFICSEFVGRILDTLNIVNISNLDYLTPSDLEKAINK
jgi:hypothetical protein